MVEWFVTHIDIYVLAPTPTHTHTHTHALFNACLELIKVSPILSVLQYWVYRPSSKQLLTDYGRRISLVIPTLPSITDKQLRKSIATTWRMSLMLMTMLYDWQSAFFLFCWSFLQSVYEKKWHTIVCIRHDMNDSYTVQRSRKRTRARKL